MASPAGGNTSNPRAPQSHVNIVAHLSRSSISQDMLTYTAHHCPSLPEKPTTRCSVCEKEFANQITLDNHLATGVCKPKVDKPTVFLAVMSAERHSQATLLSPNTNVLVQFLPQEQTCARAVTLNFRSPRCYRSTSRLARNSIRRTLATYFGAASVTRSLEAATANLSWYGIKIHRTYVKPRSVLWKRLR